MNSHYRTWLEARHCRRGPLACRIGASFAMKRSALLPVVLALVISTAGPAHAVSPAGSPAGQRWLSPTALVAAPDGKVLYIACATAGQIAVFDRNARTVSRHIPVPGSPLGLALTPDGRTLYVTCAAPDSTVCIIDTAQAAVVATIPAGHTAMAPVLSPDGRTLYICNRFNHEIAYINLATRKTTHRVKVSREPVAAAITPDGRFLLVANHLPAGRADIDVSAASVSVVDLRRARVSREIVLPNGSGMLRDVRISPDGHHAIVTHLISRFHLPTSQIERGWINTNAVTLIDTRAMQRINTVLLDNLDAGAANPWGAEWAPDGRSFVVTHAGTHELTVVDFPALLAKLARVTSTPATRPAADYTATALTPVDVPDDLSFMTDIRRRIKSGEADRGPRAVVFAGTTAYLANYFSDTVTEIDLASSAPRPTSMRLQPTPAMSVARRGEFLFNDAGICFQGWQSCASCHSSDARVDGLNWDNLNDGIGNPKNTKSLIFAHQTPPSMWLGVRADAEVAVRAGIRNSLFTVQPEEVAVAIDEYLRSLKPIPSPHLVKGKLSPAAQRGEKLFWSEAVGCAGCHPPGLYTDQKSHDVGTLGKFDKPGDRFDTPELIEVWRTAPYLHDGSAATVREVLTTRNAADRHGKTSHLTRQQIDDLVEFILSL
jgi:YVTN family beta-propeller protein